MIRVLLADDQELVRVGFGSILSKHEDIDVVGAAADGRQAVTMTQTLRPDLVLMDIRMPVMDGLAATQRIMSFPDPPRVLVLTTFDADEYVYAALRAGACGFLLKDTSPERLAAAVREAMAGDSMLAPAITRRLIESYVQAPDPQQAELWRSRLSDREIDVLQVLATGASNAEIAEQLYLAETTVKSHLARLLVKLDLRDRVQAVVFAYEHGLVRPGGTFESLPRPREFPGAVPRNAARRRRG